MHFSLEQLLTLIAAIVGAIQATLASGHARTAAGHASAAAMHALDASDSVEGLTKKLPSAIEPGVPGVSLTQLIRFWDLLSKIISFWGGFKAAPVGQANEVPLIKTKIDGRHCEIGPTPVRFTD